MSPWPFAVPVVFGLGGALAFLRRAWRRHSAEQFRFLAENAHDLVSIHDPRREWRFVYASLGFARLTGYAPDDLIGRPGAEFLHPADLAKVCEGSSRSVPGEEDAARVQCRFRTKAGSWLWLAVAQSRKTGVCSKHHVLAVARDITEIKAAEEHIRKLAFRDALTGLPNRAALLEHLETAVSRAAKSHKVVTLNYIEVEGIKRLNDTRGHRVGEAALAEFAARIARVACDQHHVARFGDHEFVVLLEDNASALLDAPRAITRLVEDLSGGFPVENEPVYLGVFAGLAVFPLHARTSEGLLAAASSAAHAARASGKNSWRVFEAEYSLVEHRRQRALVELRQAYDQGRLLLHYQPTVDITSGRCVGFEALLRLQSGQGILGSSDFIEAAEESGFIHPLTQWVVRTASAQSRDWRSTGLSLPIAVNISAKSLQKDSAAFLLFIEQMLEEDSDLAQHLELEVTESCVAADRADCIETLRQLRQRGFRLHIDDFGTGYSSLSYLCSLPFHTIKVDRTFVDGLPTAHGEIVKAIIAIARSLGMSVIAEGVETLEQLAFLHSAGCTLAQGHLFARPMPAVDAGAFAASLIKL